MKILMMLLIVLLVPVSCSGQLHNVPLVSSHGNLDSSIVVGWMEDLDILNEDSYALSLALRPADFTSTDPTLQFYRNKIEVVQLLTASTGALLAMSLYCDRMNQMTKTLIIEYAKILENDMIEAKIHNEFVKKHKHLTTTATVVISSTYSMFLEMSLSFRDE